MDIQIVPVHDEHAEGYHAGLDLVVCERRDIGIVEGDTTRGASSMAFMTI